MEENPLITIITVCYNEEKGIEKTCESVISQNEQDFEWIVIDGKSTDKTLEVLKKYKKSMSYFVSEKDHGVYDAMNKGIDKANGKYILFLNGGDLFTDKNVLKKVSEFIRKDNLENEIYYGNAVYDNGEVVDFSKSILDKDFFRHKTISHQSTFIKKELFEKYGKYDTDYKIVADFDFWVKTIVKNKVKIKYIPINISVFDQSGLSSNLKHTKQHLKERNSVLKKYNIANSLQLILQTIKVYFLAILKRIKIYEFIRKFYRKCVKR